jgi:DNA-binding beta-propeller fold protein YncE
MKCIIRVLCTLLLLAMMLCASSRISVPTSYADGGAPQLAYVAGGARGISVIDIARRSPTSTLTLAGQPRMVLLSPDGSALYVTQPGLGRVSVIATRTSKQICSVAVPGQPSLLALSIDATVLYVAGQGDKRARALDPTTCRIERTFETGGPVYGLAVAASVAANATPTTPNQLWLAGDRGLTVFEATGRLLGTIPIGGEPQYISIPAGFTAYVTTRQGSVLAVDLNTRRVIRTLLSGGAYGPMDYDATTGEVYVPERLHNQLEVLTPITADTAIMPREPVRQYSLSSSPQAIAITSDGQLGFVALADGQVLMLDIPGHRSITSITVGGTPRFIITGLYPPASAPSSPASSPPAPASSAHLSAGALWILLLLLGSACLLGAYWLFWRRKRV